MNPAHRDDTSKHVHTHPHASTQTTQGNSEQHEEYDAYLNEHEDDHEELVENEEPVDGKHQDNHEHVREKCDQAVEAGRNCTKHGHMRKMGTTKNLNSSHNLHVLTYRAAGGDDDGEW